MNSLIKTVQKPVKFSKAEWREVERAARRASRETKTIVAPITFVREMALDAIRARYPKKLVEASA